jgi:hypothetical protein
LKVGGEDMAEVIDGLGFAGRIIQDVMEQARTV